MQEDTPKNNRHEEPHEEREEEKVTTRGLLYEIIKFVVIVIPIVFFIRVFIAQPFIVDGGSMDPTFATGQYLIVDEISYRLHEPQRGDVIVFHYPKDPSRYYIKRIIGLPNETVSIENGTVSIISPVNPMGFTLDEKYVAYPKIDSETKKLGADEYFVMGDNRAASSDSRMWGPVDRSLIVGHVLVRLLPITSIGINPGEARY